MQDFERILQKYKESQFKFAERRTDWGRKYIGTRKAGLLKREEVMMIAHFDRNPSMPDFADFLDHAEKFWKEYSDGRSVAEILAVSPSELDRRTFRFLLDRTQREVRDLVRYKDLGLPVKEENVVHVAGTASRQMLDVSAVTGAIPNRGEKERLLFAWEVVAEKGGTLTPVVFAITQERGLLFKRIQDALVPHGLEVRWENILRMDADTFNEKSMLAINDGRQEWHLVDVHPQMLRSLLEHLAWARKGYATGFIREHDFDDSLVNKCEDNLLKQRFSEAVLNAFVLVENRIREDSKAPASLYGKELIDHAFHPETGAINFLREKSEKEGLYWLYRGAFALYRNPVAHKELDIGANESFEVLSLVNHLLKLSHRGGKELRR